MHLRKRHERPLLKQINRLPQRRIMKLQQLQILKQAAAFSKAMTFLFEVRKSI